MVMSLVRRLLALALLLVVAGGGGGLPVLDAVAFHGPSRLSESFRTHYEASSSCHADGCSIRSEAAPRILEDHAPAAPRVVAIRELQPVPVRETASSPTVSLPYLSRAPPAAF